MGWAQDSSELSMGYPASPIAVPMHVTVAFRHIQNPQQL